MAKKKVIARKKVMAKASAKGKKMGSMKCSCGSGKMKGECCGSSCGCC